MTDAFRSALVAEATKKSGLVWLSVDGAPARGVWHVWHEGSAYVVSGGLEQPVPGLAGARTVAVTVRSKDNGGRLLVWTAAVSPVQPGTPEWDLVVPLLHAKRLNARDGEEQPLRWARESVVLRLTPTDDRETSDDGSGAAPRRPSPALSRVPIPFTVGRWWRERGRS
jgi:hypothetical protein